jgi:hypothetical protein
VGLNPVWKRCYGDKKPAQTKQPKNNVKVDEREKFKPAGHEGQPNNVP